MKLQTTVSLLALSLAAAATVWALPPQNSAPAPAPAAQASADTPSLPTAEIIRRFSENESQFKTERGNYTYSQSVLVEASLTDGSQSGQFELRERHRLHARTASAMKKSRTRRRPRCK